MAWLIGLIAAASVGTSPVYLSCEIKRATDTLLIELALDEAGQRATLSFPPMEDTVSLRALFNANNVKILEGPSTLDVDRTSLSIKRSFDFMDEVESGQCKIKPVPAARVF